MVLSKSTGLHINAVDDVISLDDDIRILTREIAAKL